MLAFSGVSITISDITLWILSLPAILAFSGAVFVCIITKLILATN